MSKKLVLKAFFVCLVLSGSWAQMMSKEPKKVRCGINARGNPECEYHYDSIAPVMAMPAGFHQVGDTQVITEAEVTETHQLAVEKEENVFELEDRILKNALLKAGPREEQNPQNPPLIHSKPKPNKNL